MASNLTGAIKAGDINLNVRVIADRDGYQAVVAGNKRIADSASKANGAFEKMTGVARKLVAPLTALFASVSGASFARSLVNTASRFEQLKLQLVTATQSAQAAKTAFADIVQFAVKTPFEVANLTESFVLLKNVGIEPTREVMTRLGDTAGAFNRDITDLTQAFVNAAFGEFRVLKRLGIIAKNEGETISLTFRGVTTEVENSTEAIFEALLGIAANFEGGMERAAGTFQQRLSNVQDSVGQLADAFGNQSGLLPAMAEAVRQFDMGIQNATPLAEVIGRQLAKAVSFATDNWRELLAIAKAFLAVKAAQWFLTATRAGASFVTMLQLIAQGYKVAEVSALAFNRAALVSTGSAVLKFLVNPITLAVGAISLLTVGMAQSAERAREAAAFQEDWNRQLETTAKLAREVDEGLDLRRVTGRGQDAAEEQLRKLSKIEQKVKELEILGERRLPVEDALLEAYQNQADRAESVRKLEQDRLELAGKLSRAQRDLAGDAEFQSGALGEVLSIKEKIAEVDRQLAQGRQAEMTDLRSIKELEKERSEELEWQRRMHEATLPVLERISREEALPEKQQKFIDSTREATFQLQRLMEAHKQGEAAVREATIANEARNQVLSAGFTIEEALKTGVLSRAEALARLEQELKDVQNAEEAEKGTIVKLTEEMQGNVAMLEARVAALRSGAASLEQIARAELVAQAIMKAEEPITLGMIERLSRLLMKRDELIDQDRKLTQVLKETDALEDRARLTERYIAAISSGKLKVSLQDLQRLNALIRAGVDPLDEAGKEAGELATNLLEAGRQADQFDESLNEAVKQATIRQLETLKTLLEKVAATLRAMGNTGVAGAFDNLIAGIDEAIEGVENLGEKTETETKKGLNKAEEAWTSFSRSVQSSFADAIEGMLSGNLDSFSDFFDSVFDLFKRMIAEMVAYAIANKVLVNIGFAGAGGAAGAGGLLSGFKSLFGGGGGAGGAAGAAGAGGAGKFFGGIGGALAVVAAIGAVYALVGSILDKKKAEKTVGTLKFAIEAMEVVGEAIASIDELNKAMVQAGRGILATVREIERITGGIFTSLPEIHIDVRGTGEIFAMVNGVMLGAFENLQDAIDAALVAALKQAELSGAPDSFVQVLKNTTAATLEELFADLQVAAQIEALKSGEGVAAVRDAFMQLDALFQEAERLGISMEDRAAVMTAGLAAIRDDLLGIQPSGIAERLSGALEFNRQVTNWIEDIQRQMDELQVLIDQARGRADLPDDINPGTALDDLLDTSFEDSLRNIARSTQRSLEELLAEFDTLQDLMDSLPELIDLKGLAEQLALEFAGVDFSFLSVRATADSLRDAIMDLGLSADETAQLLAMVTEAEELRMRSIEVDVLQRLANILKQIPDQQEEAAKLQSKIDQARFQIEIRMIEMQLIAMGLMTAAFEDMINAAKNFGDQLANFVNKVNTSIRSVGIPDFDREGDRDRPRFPRTPRPEPRRDTGAADRARQEREEILNLLRSVELDSFSLRLRQLNERFQEAALSARRLGISEERVMKARVRAVKQLLDEVLDPLRTFQEELSLNAPQTPIAQFEKIRQRFEDLQKRAFEGDVEALRDFPGEARNFLRIAGDFFGTSSGIYRAMFREVQTNLSKFLDDPTLNLDLDHQTQAIVDALVENKMSVDTVAEILLSMRDDFLGLGPGARGGGAGAGGGAPGSGAGTGGGETAPPEEPSPPPPSTPPPGPPPEDTVPRYPEPEELSVFGKRVLRKLEGAAEINRLRSILTNIWGRGSNPRKMLLEVFKGEAGVFGIGDLRRLADSGLVGNPGHRSWIEEVLARAQGGPTSSGKLYLVGEEGPELFRPRASGQVIPLGALERFGDMAAPQEGGASAEVSEALRELGSALSELSRRQGEDKEKTDKAIQQMSEDLRQMTSRMNRVLSLLEGQVAVR